VRGLADFYEREVTDLKRIDPAKIPDYDQTIERYIRRAERVGEYEVAERFRKLKRV